MLQSTTCTNLHWLRWSYTRLTFTLFLNIRVLSFVVAVDRVTFLPRLLDQLSTTAPKIPQRALKDVAQFDVTARFWRLEATLQIILNLVTFMLKVAGNIVSKLNFKKSTVAWTSFADEKSRWKCVWEFLCYLQHRCLVYAIVTPIMCIQMNNNWIECH